MRILQFIETGGPGGAERVVSLLCSQLKEDGHCVFAGTLREGWLTNELDRLSIQKIKFNSSKYIDLRLIFELIKFCKKENIDVIHSHLLDSNFYCSIAGFLLGIPVIATEHGDIHHLKQKKFAGLKVKVISFLAKRISAVANFSKNTLVKRGAKESKVEVVRNPILVTSGNKESRAFLNLPLTEDDWLWAHVANLRPVKDQRTLIDGFNLAKQCSNRSQKLLIIGEGELRFSLEKLVKDLGLQNEVFFLGFRNDVNRILRTCNGFILSSVSEAMPMSICEAIIANLVVISSAVGGVPEIIRNNETGFLFIPNDSEDLGNKISSVLNLEKDALDSIINRAKDEISENYNLKKITNQLVELYNK